MDPINDETDPLVKTGSRRTNNPVKVLKDLFDYPIILFAIEVFKLLYNIIKVAICGVLAVMLQDSDNCDLDEMIPVFFIVFGCISLVLIIKDFWNWCFAEKYKSQQNCARFWMIYNIVLTLILYAWSIVGGFFVFPNWEKMNCSACINNGSCEKCCSLKMMTSAVCILALLYFECFVCILYFVYYCYKKVKTY